MTDKDDKSPWRRGFSDAGNENFHGDLYAACYDEIEHELPEHADDIVLYFDTDPRALEVVLTEKLNDPEAVEALAPAMRNALVNQSGPQALS